MRGFPPIQIVLLVVAFIVLAVPLSHLTGNAPSKPAVKTAEMEAKDVKVLLRLRFAHPPSTLSLKITDQEQIKSISASPLEIDASIALKNGVDVFLNATWPDGTPDTALTLEIEPDGLEARSETRWSSTGSIDDVITFSWK